MVKNEFRVCECVQPTPGKLEYEVQFGEGTKQVFFTSQDISLSPCSEVLLPVTIPFCMAGGLDLRVDDAVSEKFLLAMNTVMDIYHSWEPGWHPVRLIGTRTVKQKSGRGKRVGCFFSGGVDSWYTLLKNQDEITDLIFIHGYDIRLDDELLLNKTSQVIHTVAEDLGKGVIEIKTNLRSLTDVNVPFLMLYGPALFSVGHLLWKDFHKLYVAATNTYADLLPVGSHPLLDPLFSTEGLEIIHDGCEADRIAKVELLSRHEIVMETLRVCWRNPYGPYNCGKCEKCLRTMIQLEAVGGLEKCQTFNRKLDINEVRRMRLRGEGQRRFAQQNLQALDRHPNLHHLRRALKVALRRSRWQMPILERIDGARRNLAEKHPGLYRFLKLTERVLKLNLSKRVSLNRRRWNTSN